MHILRPYFDIDPKSAVEFAARRGFGIILAADKDGPRGSHVPFVIRETDGGVLVRLHLTAKNPLVEMADGHTRFLLIVCGPDAYVSNDWYASPDHVSTWLYEAVHLSGIAQRRSHESNRPHGDELLAEYEGRLAPKKPWTLESMESRKREGMLAAIAVIDVIIDQFEGQSKLNQHKSDEDHVAVANNLSRSRDSDSQEIARKMRSLRPHLNYGDPL